MKAVSGSTVKKLLIARARTCIGLSVYRRNATKEDAPQVLNCFRFTQWVWRAADIELPDHQLLYPEAMSVSLNEVEIADLIFVPRLNYSLEEDDFGHVGIATGKGTVIHATKWRNTVVEESLAQFVCRGVLDIRRIQK